MNENQLVLKESTLVIEAENMAKSMVMAAIEKGLDADSITKLVDLQERMIDKASKQAFSQAMTECQSEMPYIQNKAINNQTNSTYAKLDAINKAITPVYVKHGFSLSFGTADSPHEGHIRIVCDVHHSMGHSEKYHVDMPLDIAGIKGTANKTVTHATGSTISYGRRYLTNMIFNLATGDDMDGNKPVHFITAKQADDLKDMIADVGGDIEKLCKGLKIKSIESMPEEVYGKALRLIEGKRRAQ